MNLLSALLFSLSANVDTFVVALSYGLKKIRIPINSNLLIAIITTFGTFISMILGKFFSNFLSVSIASKLGSILLIIIGIYFSKDFIKQYCLKKPPNNSSLLENPTLADTDNSGTIDIKESLSLSFALSLNNLGVGFVASVSGIPIILTTIVTFIVSIVSVLLGVYLGKSVLGRICGKYAPIISALLLIALGIFELF